MRMRKKDDEDAKSDDKDAKSDYKETKSEDDKDTSKCVTINGPQKGNKCVFPFKARGVEHTKCTKAGGYSAAWCSTKTDKNGNTVMGNYGDCSEECPIED